MSQAEQNKTTGGPLWAAGDLDVDEEIVRFCAADDAVLDNDLLEDDLAATRAHVRGLGRIGVLEPAEVDQLVGEIGKLLDEARAGTFRTGPQDEDGHSAIERTLVERLGEVGKKVHTGRSRNDQVLVATRLWIRRQLQHLADHARRAAAVALERAKRHERDLMPGYTHLQRAVPSTVGFFFAGHAEALAEDALALEQARTLLDSSPLGTAAGYGVNLPLDRQGVSDELGFSRLQVNGLCAQNGRGRLEAHAVAAALTFMGSVRHLAWDLSLFASQEFGFVKMPDRWTTGSSIMPNKRNPDVVELLRAAFSTVAGAHAELLSASALPSGYQRDLQVTKAPTMRAFGIALRAAGLLPRLLAEIEFDLDACRAALEPAMLATDRAVELAVGGAPFRDAYKKVKQQLAALDEAGLVEACEKSVATRVSPGAPGQLLLERIEELLTLR